MSKRQSVEAEKRRSVGVEKWRSVKAKNQRSVKAKKQVSKRKKKRSVEAILKWRSSAAVKQNKALKENMSTLVLLKVLLLTMKLFQKSLHQKIQKDEKQPLWRVKKKKKCVKQEEKK